MLTSLNRLICVNQAMRAIKTLEPLLQVELTTDLDATADGVISWGRKPSAKRSEELAELLGLPLIRVEDGFLRSVGLGSDEDPLSVVVDDQGIYYDAHHPSRVESLIARPLQATEVLRAETLMHSWREARVSKYNQGREQSYAGQAPYVLVIDQTFADASIKFGMADEHAFLSMLEDAVEKFPEHTILVKTHPDVVAGVKRGHFDKVPTHLKGQFQLVGESIHMPAMLEHATAVFCVTSQVGFEALLWGKPVFVYGMPFYAGWGLTEDKQNPPERRLKLRQELEGRNDNSIDLNQLVHAALIAYPRYIHPETKQPCEVEALLSWMGLQRSMRERLPEELEGIGWPRWKKPVLNKFCAGSVIHFKKLSDGTTPSLKSIGWGAKATTDIRVEDGFIRSVGLGADLTMPQSWVFDDLGMYYDASKPSRLETLLQLEAFPDDLLQRAKHVRDQLVDLKVTKYNQGGSNWSPKSTSKRPLILVPGQVESDASIQLGSPQLKDNMALLKAVRQANPEAYVVYKPHPDVQAGLRVAGKDREQAMQFCDEVVLDVDMAHLLNCVDEVHTMTSLTGFEALLRGLDVTCYGQPFYSGWGLTTDVYPNPRRQRQLSLDALVAATLLLYPTYISRVSGYYCVAEQVITEMQEQRRLLDSKLASESQIQRLARLVKQRMKRLRLSLRKF